MNSGKITSIILFLLGMFISTFSFSQTIEGEQKDEILEKGIQILKKYFYDENDWHVTEPSVGKDTKALINFINDAPVDSIIKNLNRSFEENNRYVFRLQENVADSLTVPGYYSNKQIGKDIENIGLQLQAKYQKKKILLPYGVTSNLKEKLNLIPQGKEAEQFIDSLYSIPDSLQIPEVIPDSILNSPQVFQRLVRIDSVRNSYIESKRNYYNDSITTKYIDSVIAGIRKQQFEEEFSFRTKLLSDSVQDNNSNILRVYNDSIVDAVNDSILAVLKTLTEYADYIDTTQVTIVNFAGEATDIPLLNGREQFTRVWLKNVQNDSLKLLVKNIDKRSMQIFMDDGVTFSRFKQKETKQFDFNSLGKEISDFTNVGKSYEMETPWRIGGEGNVGFTQTYLQNWKKGGQSAISSLIILKGFANYERADKKVKWENSIEIRNGWIRQGGKGAEIQKNDDKFEFTSRYGISAFKKWYYSAEFNYETQFFKGFRYPTSDNPIPISGFMAPAKSFLKIGLEYKPNKEFSMLLSPLTIKNVYVRDTTLIDQTKFGIPADKNSFWEPGLNADIMYKRNITEDILYETKYKMFINFKQPFSKFDINWENVFTMRLSEYMNMRFMLHFIYDDNVMFPVYDDNDLKVGEKARLQIKEFITIGFAYKINRKVIRTKRIR